jgi:hypothetical protein
VSAILTLDGGWINESQRATIEKMLRICRHGAQRINVTMRVDGREYSFEADWIKHLNQPSPPGSAGKPICSGGVPTYNLGFDEPCPKCGATGNDSCEFDLLPHSPASPVNEREE